MDKTRKWNFSATKSSDLFRIVILVTRIEPGLPGSRKFKILPDKNIGSKLTVAEFS
jgi:hypothetical protein